MMRPLVMDFRTDARSVGVSDQYLFGRAMMVSPVVTQGAASRPVYLPAGQDWYDFWTGRRTAGGTTIDAPAPIDSLPIHVRAGSIIPMGPVVSYAGEKPDAPLELRVYGGADGAFTLYEDDGDTNGYERGQYSEIPIAWHDGARRLTIGARNGAFPGMAAGRAFHVVFAREGRGVGLPETESADATVAYSGAAVEVSAPQ
jgi:alpha-D-xyloside xylohydrolase